MNSKSYKDLIFYQKAVKVSVMIYEVTEKFPQSEIFGLTSQMRRAAVSIVSNIAEGTRRSTKKDFRQFLFIAFGSAAELEAQIEIAKQLKFAEKIDFSEIEGLLTEVLKMLNKTISTLSLQISD